MFHFSDGGLEENLGTNSVVAGLWACVYSLGEVLGPAMGGALLEHCGFPITVTFMAALNFLTAIGTTIFFCMRKKSDVTCDTKVDQTKSKSQEVESISAASDKCPNGINSTIVSEHL